MRPAILCLLLTLPILSPAQSSSPEQGRSMIVSNGGIVATPHLSRLASRRKNTRSSAGNAD